MQQVIDSTDNPKAQVNKFTGYQKLVIALLALTQFTVVLDFMVMSPLSEILLKEMDLTTVQFGVVVAAYAISAGISGMLTAGWADRYDRKKLLLFFYIGFILGTLFCGLSNSYTLLLIARIVTGIFGGVIGSISMAIVADLFPLEKRGRVMGFMQMGFGASQVLGIPISLFLANAWGWQSPFFVIVGLSTVIWLMVGFKMQPVNAHLDRKTDQNAFHHLKKTLINRNYRIGYLATALLSMGGFLMMPWGSAFSVNNLGITREQVPYLFMVAGISSLIIMPVMGKLSDKIDKFYLFTIASIWMIIMVLIYTNLGPVPLWVLMIINVAMMIGIFGRMVPSMTLTSALPEMHDRGAYMSISSSLQSLAGGIAAGVGGLIVSQKTETSPLENFTLLGILMVVIAVICIFMMMRVSNLVSRQENQASRKPRKKY